MRRKVYKTWEIGDRHYSWTIYEYVVSGTKKDGRDRFIKVRCDCGTIRIVTVCSLVEGCNLHCGCKNGKQGKQSLKHTSEYYSWRMMHQRCRNPKRKDYHRYGGRGIEVCDPWQSFENFYQDMGTKSHPSDSIDRINVNGNYEPSNCRWASPLQQRMNTRKAAKLDRAWGDNPLELFPEGHEFSIL